MTQFSETKYPDFKIVNKAPSINIAEWQLKYPQYYALVERDKDKDGYGWIRYRGAKPYPYPLSFLLETNISGYDNELLCDPKNCYEIKATRTRIYHGK